MHSILPYVATVIVY